MYFQRVYLYFILHIPLIKQFNSQEVMMSTISEKKFLTALTENYNKRRPHSIHIFREATFLSVWHQSYLYTIKDLLFCC
jgi:hypothetical protein